MTPPATRPVLRGARSLGWVVAAAVAASMASERVYWYWAGIDPASVVELATFYAVAVAVAFMALAAVPASGWRPVVLGGALFGLVVEGVITPVVYEDGPLPVLFLMFVGWHGVLAFAGFVVLVRRWALEGRWRALGLAATATGAGWGCWALASGVTDRVTAQEAALDGGSAEVLAPADFATYALWVALLLVAAHLAMDRLHPGPGWRPSRAGVATVALLGTGLLLVLVVPVVPWAPLKLAVLGGVLWLLLRRHGAAGEPTVIDQLAGRIQLRHLLPLAMLPVAAAASYAALWPLRDHAVMASLFDGAVLATVLAGVLALGWAARRVPARVAA